MKNRKPYNPKRFEWKFYKIKDGLFIYQTYNQGPTLRACPEGLRPFLACNEPIAHTHYEGSKEGYITSYLIKSDIQKLSSITRENGRILNVRNINYRDLVADWEFNIFSRHVELSDLMDAFVNMTRDDITEFCHERGSRLIRTDKEHYSLVDKIEPNPRFTLIKPKENELVKLGKGFFHDRCIINLGLDFSRGCVSNTTPEGIYDLDGRCGYCYAFQNGPSFLETLLDFDEAFLLERLDKRIKELGINKGERVYLRIGQTTEANTPEPIRSFPGFRDNLKIALSALIKAKDDYDLRIAMPTKIPEFDKETIEMFRRLKISILASIGYPELEKGIIRLGFTTEKRLESILELAKEALNANIYVVTDITNHNNMQDDAKMALEFFKKNKKYFGLQILDVRITSKEHAKKLVGPAGVALNIYNLIYFLLLVIGF